MALTRNEILKRCYLDGLTNGYLTSHTMDVAAGFVSYDKCIREKNKGKAVRDSLLENCFKMIDVRNSIKQNLTWALSCGDTLEELENQEMIKTLGAISREIRLENEKVEKLIQQKAIEYEKAVT